MVIYGVCISDIDKINEEKAEGFLKSLLESKAKDIAENYFDNKKDNDGDYSVNDWAYDYDSMGYTGLSAVIRDIIEELEKVTISCDDPDGIHYLGLSADAPWNMTEKTRNMSREEYDNILKKYTSNFTDKELEIRWWNVNDDCDW